MKKKVFLFAVLAGAICFASCKGNKDVDPEGQVQVVVNPREVTLNDEETSIRLSATLTPNDPTAVITWSSSDTTVATVTSRGYVEAQGYGVCYIYASVGDAKDSCRVHVKTWLESLIFNNAAFAGADTTYALDPETGKYKVDTVEASTGEVFYCYLSLAKYWLFSDGFYVNNSGDFDGTEKGAILEVQAPMWYGTKYLNPDGGVQFSLGKWGVNDNYDGKTPHLGAPATIDEAEYVKQMKLFLTEFNAGGKGYGQYLKAAGETVKGTYIFAMEYDAKAEGYVNSYIPDALCEGAYFSVGDDSPVSDYMHQLDFSEIKYKAFAMDTVFGSKLVTGLNLGYNEATEEIYLNDENVHFNPSVISVFGEIPSSDANEVAKRTPMHMKALFENPEVKAHLEKQIKDKNIRVIRMK